MKHVSRDPVPSSTGIKALDGQTSWFFFMRDLIAQFIQVIDFNLARFR